MEENGPIFTSVIDQLPEDQRELAKQNATEILEKILEAYQGSFDASSVGRSGTGKDLTARSGASPTGLIYGRIQSGKTRAMITTAALAFDNGFRIVVVLTTDINRLVDQTHTDFVEGIPNVHIINKDDVKKDSLEIEADTVAESLELFDDFGVIVVCSKGSTVLGQVIAFLQRVGGESFPTLILDDEGDQATLDNKVRARSKKGESTKPSTIHGLVHSDEAVSLREVLPHSVFVSVTGTPQGIVLQNLDSRSRPSFIQLLAVDPDAYTGANVFLVEADPIQNQYVTLIPGDERLALGEDGAEIPQGLKNAVGFFILSATAAGIAEGWQEYKMLCHPSMSTDAHGRVKEMLHVYIHELAQAIRNPTAAGSEPLITQLRAQYERLRQNCTDVPPFEDLLAVAARRLANRKMFEINRRTTGSLLAYVKGYNFVIGGNSVGRGLAFKNLLVTYYVREAKITNMDTMYQHARMFGYRRPILKYIQLFMPEQLYDKFFSIAESDELLRKFITEQGDKALAALIKTRSGLRPTSPSRLDANNTKTLLPGSQLYPNKPIYENPKATQALKRATERMRSLFPEYATKQGKENGKEISVTDAIELLRLIPSNGATNAWKDKQIGEILTAVSNQTGDKIILKHRTADRADRKGQMTLPTGVLGGALYEGADAKLPIIWIFTVTPKPGSWAGVDFAYPTIVWPRGMDPWVFNRS